jgi:hypothetical protein
MGIHREKSMLSLASYIAYLTPHMNQDIDLAVVYRPFGLNLISSVIPDLPTGVLVELLMGEAQGPEIDPEELTELLMDLIDPEALVSLEKHLNRKAS